MILALDFETGGLNHEKNPPVTLGLAIMEGLDVIHSDEWTFGYRDDMVYNEVAMKINGIPFERLKAAPDESIVYRDVKLWLADHEAQNMPVVSHNAAFDQNFWSQWLFRLGKKIDGVYRVAPELLYGPWECTRRMAGKLGKEIPNHKLDTVAAHFGLSRSSEVHGAMEDAILAGKVYHWLKEGR